MYKILYILYTFFFIIFILGNALILPKYKIFMKRKQEYRELMNLINNNEKRPILLNGHKTYFKKDFCEIFCQINNITFREYNFDKFILELPYKKYKNNIIYVSDFFIDNGRVFNDYEEYILSNLIQTNNLIIFESEIIDKKLYIEQKLIKNTDMNLNFSVFSEVNANENGIEWINPSFLTKDLFLNMKKIEFSEITKIDIQDYIYYIILYYKYNSSMLLLNWYSYDIDKLDIEKINLLLFVLNNMFNENYSLRKIHNNVNNIIESITESSIKENNESSLQ